jgi:hypothetical protein
MKLILKIIIGLASLLIALVELSLIAYIVINKLIIWIIIIIFVSLVMAVGFSGSLTKDKQARISREKSSSLAADIYISLGLIIALGIILYSYFNNYIYWEIGVTVLFTVYLFVAIKSLITMKLDTRYLSIKDYIKKARRETKTEDTEI